MKTHTITGLGPVQTDGSVEIFTVLPKPFLVTKAWLDQYPAMPSVGDELAEQEDGTLALTHEVSTGVVEQDAEPKKDDGSVASGNGSEPSQLLTYVAKPFTVQAGEITHMAGDMAKLSNGVTVKVNTDAEVGDFYLVDDTGGGVLPAGRFNTYFQLQGE